MSPAKDPADLNLRPKAAVQGAATRREVPVLSDSHAHLGLLLERLGGEALDEVIGRYRAAWDDAAAMGFEGPLVVDPGVEAGDFPARKALLGGLGFVRLAAGIWPSEKALADPRGSLSALRAALDGTGGRDPPAAVGEGGLDYFHMNGSRAAQRELFEGLLAFAGELGLGMIVHSRDAAADTLSILRGAACPRPPVMHCFGYGPAEAEAFLDAGCCISFAGNLTYRSAGALREACALVPADRLLLETDSPYMNPEPGRGRPSTPLDIARTYEAAAAVRGVGPRELAESIAANVKRIFGP